MKRILFIFSIALLTGAALNAQTPWGRAYPNGVFVFCGREIPRNFYYLVEKKGADGQWAQVAELRAPNGAAALQANLLNLPAFIRTTTPLPIDQSDFLWTLQSKGFTIDSLSVYAHDPKILAAVGCGWFDDGLAAGVTCQYRISRVHRRGDVIVLGELSQPFPQNNYQGTLEILQFRPDDDEVTLVYGLSDTTSTYNLKLYRSRFRENNYLEASSSADYAKRNGRTVAVVRDESVTKGMAYSYVAIPYDFLGNMGTPSDTINIYNLTKLADIGFVSEISAVADEENEGVALSWKAETEFYIHGYDLYRSKDFDIGYDHIAALPAETTTYFDDGVDPGEAYFYFVTMSNGFGSSMPSARVPVILEGAKANILPPQDLEVSLQGNQVKLTFNNIEPDTRSYQIFRGEGFTGELSLIASFQSADSAVVFVDSLALSVMPQTYSYAVADVNTSGNISPLSERVSIQYSGGMLPVPTISETQLRDGGIFVVWDNVSEQNAFIAAYNLWRSTVSSEGVEEEPQIVVTLPYHVNSYVDTLLTPGAHYRYAVESVGVNDEKSNLSLHAGVVVPQKFPLPPGQVSAIAAADRILLRWDTPLDPSLRNIRIYRAVINEQASLLKELPPNQSAFEDQTAKKGEQYFYYVVTVNERGLESRADEPVSGRVR